MSERKPFLLFFCVLLSLHVYSQKKPDKEKLYNYPEQLRAYRKLSRNENGAPGPDYWQNRSKYKIKAALDTLTGKISGSESVTYFNNSPDSLSYIVIRTYPDFYKSTGVKDYTIDKGDSSDGMNISKINLEKDSVKLDRAGTNMYLTLPHKLAPGKQLTLDIEWDFVLPKTTHIREGRFYRNTFLAAYWYPQISVYDDVNGWDSFNYTGLQEFYNDFSDFEVNITTEGNNLVWATGDWLNPQQILNNKYYKRYRNALASDIPVQIIDSADRQNDQITRSPGSNHYLFKADSVSDFSFAVSSTYLWKMIKVPDSTELDINFIYHPTKKKFENLVSPAIQTIRYLSDTYPGIKYPFKHLTVFDGDGGMEYAMMISQGYFGDEQAATVLAHEIVHSYFPFLVGSNERRYAWMDEAFAQTLPVGMELSAGNSKFHPQETTQWSVDYFNGFIGSSLETPPMELSINTKGGSYYFSAYTRPAFALDYLKQILGEAVFKKSVRAYVDRWRYKHPTPYDLFYTFNDISGRNLNWFWNPWFFNRGFADLKLSSVKVRRSVIDIEIKKTGSLPVPVQLTLCFADGTKSVYYESAGVWENNDHILLSKKNRNGKKLIRVELNKTMIPDINPADNTVIIR